MPLQNPIVNWRNSSTFTLWFVGAMLFSLAVLLLEIPTVVATHDLGEWGLVPWGMSMTVFVVWYRRWKARWRVRRQQTRVQP